MQIQESLQVISSHHYKKKRDPVFLVNSYPFFEMGIIMELGSSESIHQIVDSSF